MALITHYLAHDVFVYAIDRLAGSPPGDNVHTHTHGVKREIVIVKCVWTGVSKA